MPNRVGRVACRQRAAPRDARPGYRKTEPWALSLQRVIHVCLSASRTASPRQRPARHGEAEAVVPARTEPLPFFRFPYSSTTTASVAARVVSTSSSNFDLTVQIGDQVIDGSIRNRLNQLREAL